MLKLKDEYKTKTIHWGGKDHELLTMDPKLYKFIVKDMAFLFEEKVKVIIQETKPKKND